MQMLQAVSNIAPRGVYVCGNATSSSGLTVSKACIVFVCGFVLGVNLTPLVVSLTVLILRKLFSLSLKVGIVVFTL